MKEQWIRIEKWLGDHAPHLLADLREGASDADLARLEQQCERRLPESFRAFYLVHDGQESESPNGLFYSLQFMPLALVCEYQKIWAGLVDMNAEMASAMKSLPEGHIKPLYADPKWIPFAHDQSGNHLGVDLDPDSKGLVGQVIVFGRDEDCKKLVAPSFQSFVDAVVRELEGGNFILRDEILEFHHYPDGTPLGDRGCHPNDVFGRGI